MTDNEKREALVEEVRNSSDFIVYELTHHTLDKDMVESGLASMEDTIRAIRRYLRLIK